jgi:hypothetical protein
MPARGKLHDQRSRLIKINRVSRRRHLPRLISMSSLQLQALQGSASHFDLLIHDVYRMFLPGV